MIEDETTCIEELKLHIERASPGSSPVAAWFVHKVPADKLRPMIGVMAVLLGLFTLIKAYL